MASSRLAKQFPSLFGPSRRAAWRLSLVRRALAVVAILLALHLTLGAVRPPAAAPAPATERAGPELSLPLAMPADHLLPGDTVAVYLPGRGSPVATGARISGTSQTPSGTTVARVTLRRTDVEPILRQMGDAGAGQGGFVLVAGG
ncbi:MAG: hypothetical protein L0G89_06295 [Janibacter sp.]|nr:hypothetical protein [Janibacter sp.]